MRTSVTSAIAMLAILAAFNVTLGAIEKNSATGVFRSVEQKSRDRVLYYLFNTPIMQEDPYVEVSVQLRGTVIVGEYTPRYAGEPLPDTWKVGQPVQVRLEKHHIYLQRPGGGEVKFLISDRYKPKPTSNTD